MRLSLSAHCLVTEPVTRSTSAWRGEGSSLTPKRSTSYFGVSRETISMSQPLQAPLLKCRTHGDFTRAQVLVSVNFFSSVFSSSEKSPTCGEDNSQVHD